MVSISASCERCKSVKLTEADVRVRVCKDNNYGEYSFKCPICGMTVVKYAEPRTIDLLVASGVAIDTWELPAELKEPHSGPEIDHDDILDFHYDLHDPSVFDEALTVELEL